MTAGTVVRIGTAVIAVLVLLVSALWIFQRRLIYQPDTSAPPVANSVLPGAVDATITTSDEVGLGAWYVPSSGERRDVTVLVANGNGGNRVGRAPLAAALRERGFDVLLFDYRGYGGNAGTPTQEGLARDVRAAREYLAVERGIAQEQLIYFGESLGCAVVAELATEYPPAGLLLRSPFTDLAAAARAQLPLVPADWLLWDEYPVLENVGEVDVPTTVVYGSADSIVPPAQSRAVAAAAAGDVEIVAVDGAGHNDDALFDGGLLIEAVVELSDRG